MKDVLEYIVKAVVDNPDAIQIDELDDNGFVTYTVHAAKEDMGKLIGKGGKIIRSIRDVVKIAAMKQQKKVHVQLSEE